MPSDEDPSERKLLVDAVTVRRLFRDGEATGTLYEHDADGDLVSESIEIVNTSGTRKPTWRQLAQYAALGFAITLGAVLLVALVGALGGADYEPLIGNPDASPWPFVAEMWIVVLVVAAIKYLSDWAGWTGR